MLRAVYEHARTGSGIGTRHRDLGSAEGLDELESALVQVGPSSYCHVSRDSPSVENQRERAASSELMEEVL